MEPEPSANSPKDRFFAVCVALILIILMVGFTILATMMLFGLNAVVEPYFAGSTTGP